MADKNQKSAELKIHVSGLTKDFGENHVLRGIDIDIHAGEVVCVIGPSGSGPPPARSSSTASPSPDPRPTSTRSVSTWAWSSSSSTYSRTTA